MYAINARLFMVMPNLGFCYLFSWVFYLNSLYDIQKYNFLKSIIYYDKRITLNSPKAEKIIKSFDVSNLLNQLPKYI